jgi:hypothetical protein
MLHAYRCSTTLIHSAVQASKGVTQFYNFKYTESVVGIAVTSTLCAVLRSVVSQILHCAALCSSAAGCTNNAVYCSVSPLHVSITVTVSSQLEHMYATVLMRTWHT